MNRQFIIKLAKALGDDFFLCDMIYQEELFCKTRRGRKYNL
jgi:hypothetical protein